MYFTLCYIYTLNDNEGQHRGNSQLLIQTRLNGYISNFEIAT